MAKQNTKQAPALAKEVQQELANMPTKSAKIRYLASKGYSRADIARYMDIRYQHVRNVLINPPKKQGE